jgi:hypothetical protein
MQARHPNQKIFMQINDTVVHAYLHTHVVIAEDAIVNTVARTFDKFSS